MTPPLPVPLCYSKTFKQMKAALNDAYTVCVRQRKKNIRDWVEMNKKWVGWLVLQMDDQCCLFFHKQLLHCISCLHIHSYIHKNKPRQLPGAFELTRLGWQSHSTSFCTPEFRYGWRRKSWSKKKQTTNPSPSPLFHSPVSRCSILPYSQ